MKPPGAGLFPKGRESQGVTYASPCALATPVSSREAVGIGGTTVSSQFSATFSDPGIFHDFPGRKELKFFSQLGKIINLMLLPLFSIPWPPSCVILPVTMHAIVNKKH